MAECCDDGLFNQYHIVNNPDYSPNIPDVVVNVDSNFEINIEDIAPFDN